MNNTSSSFLTNVQIAQKQKDADDQAAADDSSECKTCRKSYSSKNAYENHLASKKHKETEAKLKANPRPVVKVEKPVKSDVESITSKMTVDLSVTDETTQEELEEIMDKKIETAVRLELTDCLFCTEKAETFERYAFLCFFRGIEQDYRGAGCFRNDSIFVKR